MLKKRKKYFVMLYFVYLCSHIFAPKQLILPV